jgi:phage terminase small subunit
MPGRKPKPTAIKLIQGTFNVSRANPTEPKPELGAPDRPKYLKGEAKKEWDRQVGYLTRDGVLAKREHAMLAAYCVLHGQFVESVRKGTPLIASLIAQYRALATEFGLTPSSRVKTHAAKPQEAQQNGWARLAN